MKKLLTLLFSNLIILSLASCGGSPLNSGSSGSDNSNNSGGDSVSIDGGDNTVLLVLGPTGLYNGEVQEDYPPYENVIEYTAPVSSLLPGSDVITCTSAGYSFETWVSYEGDGTPTRFSTMPSEGYKVLHAWFKSGGTSSDPSTSEGPSGDTKTIYLNPSIWATDSPKYYAWVWSNDVDGKFVDFVAEGSLYKINIASTNTGIVFLRASSAMEHGWVKDTNYWNKTVDETINYTNNVFTVTSWSDGTDGNSTGTWGAKS